VSAHTIATIVIPAIAALGGILGFFFRYFLERKQASASASAQYKRDMYQGYVNTVLSFYQNKSSTDEQEQAERTKKFNEETKDFQSKFILDATPAVIRAIRRQHKYFKRCNDRGMDVDERKGQCLNARIFKMMRRDIGTSNWGLGPTAGIIFSPINMYNYEEIMHPIWWREKKLIRKVYWRAVAPISTRWLAYKKKLYDWAAKS